MKFIVPYRTDKIAILDFKILVCDLKYEESYFILFRNNWASFEYSRAGFFLGFFGKSTESKFKLP